MNVRRHPSYTFDEPFAGNGPQIAVVFAIVIGGVILLAGVVYAIYIVVVKSMRGDDKQRQQPASEFAYNPAPSQSFDYPAQIRTPVNATSYTPVPSVTPYNPQQYSNVPLATPTTQQYIQAQAIPQYAPDVIYTQGPQGYVQQQPIEYSVQRQSPGANFVQSSV
ncbi:Protein CBG00604 [Caenorhabditis briggsae]|uniref:Protein CBG00604 n=1 Tax=Caenorhabditis briggsae TaxID=6238 RepID=A8WNH2_CAEBR|nr:Protein CBG00604 [Caenorhabditis briggsae]CAP22026.2 Protein CBG00604 [Caenorhabditis briggsae]